MQYHVNGFQPRDPDVHPVAPGYLRADDPLPQAVGVLIAGSGPVPCCPTGLRVADPHDTGRTETCVVDLRDRPSPEISVLAGRADASLLQLLRRAPSCRPWRASSSTTCRSPAA